MATEQDRVERAIDIRAGNYRTKTPGTAAAATTAAAAVSAIAPVSAEGVTASPALCTIAFAAITPKRAGPAAAAAVMVARITCAAGARSIICLTGPFSEGEGPTRTTSGEGRLRNAHKQKRHRSRKRRNRGREQRALLQ